MSKSASKILVTRPEPDCEGTAARLEGLGLIPIIVPILEMHVIPASLPDPKTLDALIVTSANAIRSLASKQALGPYVHLPVFTVGDTTAKACQTEGFETVTSADGNLSDLAQLLRQQNFDKCQFYPKGVHSSGDLAGLLAGTSADIKQVPVYDMLPMDELPQDLIASLCAGEIAAASFYSRRTAQIFSDLAAPHLNNSQKQNLAALCLSENVAAPLLKNGFTRTMLADYPSEEAMMALALSFSRHQIR